MNRGIFSLCTFLALALIAPPLAAEVVERDFHKSFDVAAGARLQLVHGDGDVVIEPWDRDVIDVKVRYHVEVRSLGVGRRLGDLDVEFEQRGETVRVVGREEGRSGIGIGFFSRREYEYVYSIQAPEWVVLELEGDDGDVRIEGWKAAVDIDLDDGDVTLADLDTGPTRLRFEDGDIDLRGMGGELRLQGDDGDVRLEECDCTEVVMRLEDGDVWVARSRGRFDFEVDDGDIELYGVDAARLRVDAADGDVEAELTTAGAIDLDVATQDGDVDLRFGPDVSATFSVSTDDGSIRLRLPNARQVSKEPHLTRGAIGDGRGKIRVRTHDGDVTLRQSARPADSGVTG